jgi:pyruvate formate lyase activating enzyme
MVIFTVGCNLSCGFCHNKYLLSPNVGVEYDVNELIKRIKSNVLVDSVSVSGGEPTLQADLLKICKEIKVLGKYLSVDTNGTHPEIIEDILPYIDRISMDLKAPFNSKRTRLITNSDIDPEIIKGTFFLVNNNQKIDIEIRTTYALNLSLPKDIHDILQFLKKNQFRGDFVLQQYQYSEGVGNYFKNDYEKPEHGTLLNILSRYKNKKFPFNIYLRDDVIGYMNIHDIFKLTLKDL